LATDCLLLDLGHWDYMDVWLLQRQLVEIRADGKIPDTLILVEHPSVLTVGRRGNAANILSKELPVYEIERGGDVTYHGPGQLVGYPIINLEERGQDVHRYLRDLEEVLIRAMREFGLSTTRHEGHAGVWINDKKLASIGVAVKRWTTYHGFALNVTTDLKYFQLIRPCGLDSSAITSMQELLGKRFDLEIVKEKVKKHFCDVFAKILTPVEDSWEPVQAIRKTNHQYSSQVSGPKAT